jgi:hypothetical protein
VVTPDFDIYAEDLQQDAFISALKVCMADGALPLGIDPAEVYGFAPITLPQRLRLLEEGALVTTQEKRRRGLAVGPGNAAGAAAAPVLTFLAAVAGLPPGVLFVAAGVGGAWVADEPGTDYEIGDEFGLPAGAAVVGDRALVAIGRDTAVLRHLVAGANVTEYVRARKEILGEDDRVMPVSSDRRRTFAECVHSMVAVDTPVGAPRPLQGPRTAAEWLDSVVTQGHVNLGSRHNKWVSESGIKHTDRLVYEHEVLSKVLDVAMIWDSANIKNLWFAEMFLRRLQLLEHAVSEDSADPSYEGASHFMGSHDTSAGGYIAPSLQSFVASELGKHTAILKEKRKSREAKLAKAKSKGQGKGVSKGGGVAP